MFLPDAECKPALFTHSEVARTVNETLDFLVLLLRTQPLHLRFPCLKSIVKFTVSVHIEALAKSLCHLHQVFCLQNFLSHIPVFLLRYQINLPFQINSATLITVILESCVKLVRERILHLDVMLSGNSRMSAHLVFTRAASQVLTPSMH
jgi:hypothetical protein